MEDTENMENEDVVIELDPVKDKDFIEKWGLETDGYASDEFDDDE